MAEDMPRCGVSHDHTDLVKHREKEMPSEELLCDVAELYKVFGDSTRIKILYSLFPGELCVCDISSVVKMSQSAVSHQLRILKNAKLIKYRKDGKSVIYFLADDHVKTILGQGTKHVKE